MENHPTLVHEKRVRATTSRDATLALRCVLSGDDSEVHELRSEGTEHRFVLQGLLAEASYDCRLFTNREETSFGLTTDPIPFEAPTTTVSGDNPEGHYTLLNHQIARGAGGEQKLLILDADGRIRWYLVLGGTARDLDASYLGDGSVLFGGGYEIAPTIVDLSQETVLSLSEPKSGGKWHHHASPHKGGILALATADNTDGQTTWTGFSVERYTSDGALSWAWNSQSAVDQGTLTPGDDDPWHANWAAEHDGDLWVSLRDLDRIARIDLESGVLTWQLGRGGDFLLLDEEGEPLQDEGWFFGQHSPDIDGNRLLVYDNGWGGPLPHQSRVLELLLDEDARTATRVWEWTEGFWFEAIWGDVEWLDDGRVWLTQGHCPDCGEPDQRSSVVLIDPATAETVWRLDFDGDEDGVYRSDPIDPCEIFDNERYEPQAGC